MRLNYKIIINFIGIILILNGLCMGLASLVSLYYNEPIYPFLIGAALSIIVGGTSWFFMRNAPRVFKKKEGYLIVALGWLFVTFSGMLPYLISGAIPQVSSALFETMSGYTTTGATMLQDIESIDKSILFWRSLTHWIGGMGIIVLAIAILPILGIGGMELFLAESPGPTADKLHPRITQTAKRLWFVYVGLTSIETALLRIAGMGWFDALNHSMSTVSTGGFSTKNLSVAAFNSPLIEYIICFFMFVAGCSFTLIYFGFKGKFKNFLKNEEFKFYSIIIFALTIILTLSLSSLYDTSVESNFRSALFQVIAIITTTGFVTADYTAWAPFITILFFTMLFVGASAGSTAGGVKIVRHLIILKNSILEFKRLLHPSAIIPVRLNKKVIMPKVSFNVLAFFLLYVLIFMFGAIVMAMNGEDFLTSLGASASCLGNVGPGIGDVGPVDNYANISSFGKMFLTFLMLMGRLELFTILILLTPFFWKNN